MKNLSSSQTQSVSRREFITTTAVAGTALLAAPALLAQASPAVRKTRYALVGTGHRSDLYRTAVLKTHAPYCEMDSTK